MTFFEWSLVSEERKQQIVGSWVTSFSLYFKSKVNGGCPEAVIQRQKRTETKLKYKCIFSFKIFLNKFKN